MRALSAFLKRQYQTIGMIALVLAVLVFVGLSPVPADSAVRNQDGGQFSGGSHLFRAGRVHRDVLLDPGKYPGGIGSA